MSDDLLDALDEFLDDSIVLPPGDWDENLLLPVMHEREERRKRKGESVYQLVTCLHFGVLIRGFTSLCFISQRVRQ